MVHLVWPRVLAVRARCAHRVAQSGMAGARRDGQNHVCGVWFCHRDGHLFLAARYGSHFSDSAIGRSNRLMNSELSMSLRWYVVHAYSNFEHKVSESLKERVKRAGLEAKFGEILVPTEEVVEMRDGQKRKSDRKFFPGYVLVTRTVRSSTPTPSKPYECFQST